jgi:hypothetical protein
VRRVKRTVKHVAPMSVLKLSLFFYAVFLIAWLIVVAILYFFLSSTGVFDSIEQIGRGFAISSLRDLDISLFLVEKYAFLLGVIVSIAGSLLNLFIALLYNVAADSIGGVSLTFVEKEL